MRARLYANREDVSRASRWLGILLTVALISGHVSRAADASTEPREMLRAVTKIAGTRPASVSVRLPKAATVSTTFESNPDLRVKGRGRFVGFALVPEDPEVPTLIGGRLPKSAGGFRAVMPVAGESFHAVAQTYPYEVTLPPGNYRLYFLPDGAPAQVTLKFHGLSGTTVLRPSKTVRYELLEPEVYSPDGVGNYYSAGSERQLKSKGLIFQALWLRADAHLDGVFHFCVNGPWTPTQGQLPAEIAYGPGCGGAGAGLAQDRRVDTEPHIKVYYESMAPLEPALYGQGFYFATGSVVEAVGHLALWLHYD